MRNIVYSCKYGAASFTYLTKQLCTETINCSIEPADAGGSMGLGLAVEQRRMQANNTTVYMPGLSVCKVYRQRKEWQCC